MPPTKHTFSGSIPLPIIHFQHLALIHASFWGITPPSSHTFLAKSEGVNPPLMFIHYQKCRIHPPYSWTSSGRGCSRYHQSLWSSIPLILAVQYPYIISWVKTCNCCNAQFLLFKTHMIISCNFNVSMHFSSWWFQIDILCRYPKIQPQTAWDDDSVTQPA